MTALLNREPRVEDLEDRIKKRFENHEFWIVHPEDPTTCLAKSFYGNRVSAASMSLSLPRSLRLNYSAHNYTAKQLEQIVGLWDKHLTRLQEEIDRIMPSFSVPTSMEILYHPAIQLRDYWQHKIMLLMKFPHMTAQFLLKCKGERTKQIRQGDGYEKIFPSIDHFRSNHVRMLVEDLRKTLELENYPEALHDSIVELFLQTVNEECLQQLPTDRLRLSETKDTDWQFVGIGSRKKGQKRIVVDENRFKQPGIEVIPVVVNKYYNDPRVFALIDEEWWTCTRRNRNPVKHIEHRKMEKLDPEFDMYTITKLEEIMMGLFSQSEDK